MGGRDKKRILILTNDAKTFALFRGEIIQALAEIGAEVTLSLPADETATALAQFGCRVVETPIHRRGINPFQDLALIRRYQQLIRSVRPDLILTYTIKPNIYGGWAAARFGVPCLATITGMGTAVENPGWLQSVTLFLYRRGLKNSRHVFVQNERNRTLLLTHKIVSPERVVMVPGSGVNLRKHSFTPFPPDDGTFRFLFVGRLMRDKGVDEFAETARRIKKKYPSAEFDILGGYEERYEPLLQTLTADGIVNYHGYQKDVPAFLQKCHAIVLPSYHEGMANVLLEAAATGRAIIASNISGCRETFDEGVSGFGFEPKNVDDLCRAVEAFIALPYEQKKSFGEAGRRKMEDQFDRKRVIDTYMKVIGEIIGL